MANKPEELLKYADELMNGSEELHFRNAAGRGFYYAHHICLPIADILAASYNSKIEYSDKTHARIIWLFNNYIGKDEIERKIRSLGAMYFQIRDIRTDADYLERDFSKSEAETLMKTVKNIKNKITELEKVDLP